jgi:hypothetical protein
MLVVKPLGIDGLLAALKTRKNLTATITKIRVLVAKLHFALEF